jgi:hypothetical protein
VYSSLHFLSDVFVVNFRVEIMKSRFIVNCSGAKKGTATALAVVLGFGLAGCSGGESESTSQDSETSDRVSPMEELKSDVQRRLLKGIATYNIVAPAQAEACGNRYDYIIEGSNVYWATIEKLGIAGEAGSEPVYKGKPDVEKWQPKDYRCGLHAQADRLESRGQFTEIEAAESRGASFALGRTIRNPHEQITNEDPSISKLGLYSGIYAACLMVNPSRSDTIHLGSAKGFIQKGAELARTYPEYFLPSRYETAMDMPGMFPDTAEEDYGYVESLSELSTGLILGLDLGAFQQSVGLCPSNPQGMSAFQKELTLYLGKVEDHVQEHSR